uniref:Ependymin-like 1 n=1 Tax=Cyprinus carpio TaxID=7962 RepID=A0A8C1T7V1_CYPCA
WITLCTNVTNVLHEVNHVVCVTGTPPLLSGSMSFVNGQVWAVAKYHYDALLDLLFLFRKGVVYTIDDRNRTCQKNPLKVPFHPLHIPHNASLQSQVVLGGSSACNEGLLVNTWTGDVPEIGGECHVDLTVTQQYFGNWFCKESETQSYGEWRSVLEERGYRGEKRK